jgi:hypothetical protein
MARRKLALSKLGDLLVDLTTKMLKRDATFLARMIVVRRREGEPNWDANIGVAPPEVLKAFGLALQTMQENYDVEWDEAPQA